MPVSEYKKAKIEKVKKEAQNLYKQGYSVRSIGKLLGVSHTLVWLYVKELSTSKT